TTGALAGPHAEEQLVLLERIVTNVDKLNDSLDELNDRLREINSLNQDVVLLREIWRNLERNIQFHLRSTG
ncbi:hypothetical protein GQ42DRAFT_108413, partial [Ramicandelaber brevisporus]